MAKCKEHARTNPACPICVRESQGRFGPKKASVVITEFEVMLIVGYYNEMAEKLETHANAYGKDYRVMIDLADDYRRRAAKLIGALI